jgi:hypothetical protein
LAGATGIERPDSTLKPEEVTPDMLAEAAAAKTATHAV